MNSPYTVSPYLRVTALEPAEAREDLGWQDAALCMQVDPEIFFPEEGGSARAAKRVCRNCTVQFLCLGYALEHDERSGIWGGMSERERRRLIRGAPSPRPPAERQSAHEGVTWDTARQQWAARIRIDGSRRRLGFFAGEDDAARAVARALQPEEDAA